MRCPYLEEMLLDLAHGGPGEDVAKLDDLGHLEGGEPLPAPSDELACGGGGALLEDDVGLEGVISNRVRHRHHRRVEDRGVLLQGLLHLRGGYVLAGALDHILLPIPAGEAA